MEITTRIQTFTLPNYIKVNGPFGDSSGIDVSVLFKNDDDAGQYWDEMKAHWLEHIRNRRKWREEVLRAEGKTASNDK